MRLRVRNALITVGWAIVTSSIILQTLYQQPALSALDYLSIFAVSLLAGLLLSDVEAAVLGCAGSLVITVLIMFICLILPANLGEVRYGHLADLLYGGALVMILRSMLPVSVILCLIGGLIGSFLAESLGLY